MTILQTYNTRLLRAAHETRVEKLQSDCVVCLNTYHNHLLPVGETNTDSLIPASASYSVQVCENHSSYSPYKQDCRKIQNNVHGTG